MSSVSDQAFIQSLTMRLEQEIERLRHEGQIDDLVARSFAERFYADELAKLTEPRLQQLAIRTIGRVLARAGEEFNLPFPRRRLPRPPQPATPLRRSGWSEAADFTFLCWDRLHLLLDQRCRNVAPANRPGVILASAILRGMVLRPAAWPILLNQLISGQLRLQSVPALPDLPWVDLMLPLTAGEATNEGQESQLLRVFPDVVTLSLLRRWPQKVGNRAGLVTTPGAALRQMVTALFLEERLSLPSAEDFAAAAMAPREDQSDHSLPYALTAIASGQVQSFSVSHKGWLQLHGAEHQAFGQDPSPATRPKSRGGLPQPASATPAVALHGLKRALETLPPGAAKQSRKPVEHALNALGAADLTPVARGLQAWYLHLLQAGRKVSTVLRYHHAIARPLITLCQVEDPAKWAEGDLEDLLAVIIGTDTMINGGYDLGRLGQFFTFAAANPALRWPEVDLSAFLGEVKTHPVIRTGLLSGEQIRHGFKNWPADQNKALVDLEQVAFLLAVRGGLRLSELAALTVADATPGPRGGVLVHVTRWADLKSVAARRKVPVQLLSTGDEARFLDQYFRRRQSEAITGSDQLLSLPRDFLTQSGFDGKGFARRLRQVLGVSPHDLRHTALSHLSLLLMSHSAQARVLERLTGWPEVQQSNVRVALLGPQSDGRRGLMQLARLAGHSRPEVTLRHYCHLGDLALGLNLRTDPEALPHAQASAWLGLNHRSLPIKETPVVLESCRPLILKRSEIKILPVQKEDAVHRATTEQKDTIGTAEILRLLSDLDRGLSLDELVRHQNIDRRLLDRWDRTAKALTQAVGVVDTSQRLPPMPRRKEDQVISRHLLQTLEKLNPKQVQAWSLQTIRAARKSDFTFASCQQFINWQALISGVLPTKHWLITKSATRLRACPRAPDAQRSLSMATLTIPAILLLCQATAEVNHELRGRLIAEARPL